MKLISEQKALEVLRAIKHDLKDRITSNYENKAKDCLSCETQGACCLDAHFVNVRISRLEGAAIRQVLEGLDPQHRARVNDRIDMTVMHYGLTEDAGETFACPLFERGTGCLVHNKAKPAACTMHACYEDPADLPPDELLSSEENKIDALNRQVYGAVRPWLPLPLAIRSVR